MGSDKKAHGFCKAELRERFRLVFYAGTIPHYFRTERLRLRSNGQAARRTWPKRAREHGKRAREPLRLQPSQATGAKSLFDFYRARKRVGKAHGSKVRCSADNSRDARKPGGTPCDAPSHPRSPKQPRSSTSTALQSPESPPRHTSRQAPDTRKAPYRA